MKKIILLLMSILILSVGDIFSQNRHRNQGDTCKMKKECKKEIKCQASTKTKTVNVTDCKPGTTANTTVCKSGTKTITTKTK